MQFVTTETFLWSLWTAVSFLYICMRFSCQREASCAIFIVRLCFISWASLFFIRLWYKLRKYRLFRISKTTYFSSLLNVDVRSTFPCNQITRWSSIFFASRIMKKTTTSVLVATVRGHHSNLPLYWFATFYSEYFSLYNPPYLSGLEIGPTMYWFMHITGWGQFMRLS